MQWSVVLHKEKFSQSEKQTGFFHHNEKLNFNSTFEHFISVKKEQNLKVNKNELK